VSRGLAGVRRGLEPRRRRALLTGIALAPAMLCSALATADGLGHGLPARPEPPTSRT
jgi:hypothetical protein